MGFVHGVGSGSRTAKREKVSIGKIMDDGRARIEEFLSSHVEVEIINDIANLVGNIRHQFVETRHRGPIATTRFFRPAA
jgi:hypothetical protein